MSLVQAERLTKTYRVGDIDVPAIKGLDFALEPASFVAFVGPSGTIAAIGTPPGRILSLFLAEGLMLGIVGTLAGTLLSLVAILGINVWKPTFDFGMQQNLVMAPTIATGDVLTIAALVVVVAIIASLQPAWKASRMDPISALRHV